MKKKLYQWHRRLSLIIAIPVLVWASSGFMHPIMTNLRPAIATQGLSPMAIDRHRLRVPLAVALRQHHLDSLSNVRLIHIDTNWFYQVQPATGRTPATAANTPASGTPIYLSCTNGNVLPAGDWLYAQYLARQFLEGPERPEGSERSEGSEHPHKGPPASSIPDCCGAATECVLNPIRGSKVSNVSELSGFDNEYQSINRLLPVYRVSFDRPDGIRVYVETAHDRFAFAIDNRRAVFEEIFRLFHTWGWLDLLGKGKLGVMLIFVLLALTTTILGIYLFFTTRSKNVNGNPLIKARRNHRYTAIVASLFTLMWTFSGSYHLISKFTDDTRDRYFVNERFAAADATPDYDRLQALLPGPITNLSLVKIDGAVYWQVYTRPANPPGSAKDVAKDMTKDLMKDKKVSPPPVFYINTQDYTLLPDGDAKYADRLATRFSGEPASSIRSTTPVTAFTDEYNFTDKRLPVWKVSYDRDHHQRYYVETSTGKLSKSINDLSLLEEYSFAFFHKHEFMGWGGKGLKDASTMFWAAAQILLVLLGLILYFKFRKK
ncbi:MAG TPA: hypothetical protein VGM30_09305 [Puia sp.]|jgi:hypothetical protein